MKLSLNANTKTPQNALVKWPMKHTNCEIFASAFSMGLKMDEKNYSKSKKQEEEEAMKKSKVIGYDSPKQ